MQQSPAAAGTSRRVWRLTAGDISRLRLVREVLPPPAAGEVTVRVKSIGLNFADVFSCLGLYSATPKGEYTPGLEFAGVIEQVGPPAASGQQKQFAVGDKVMGVTRFGAYATHINQTTEYIYPLPNSWNFDQGAAFLTQALTAWYGLMDLGSIKAGQTVLVHSAAGGVGLFALEILQKLGCTPIGTVSSQSKVKFLSERTGLSEAHFIVRDSKNWASQMDHTLRAVSKKGFDVVFDSLLGEFFWPTYQRLNPRGRFVVFGAGSMMQKSDSPSWLSLGWRYWNRPRLDPLTMMAENKSVMSFNLIWLYEEVETLQPLVDQMMKFAWKEPYVGHVYPFEKAPDALRFFQQGTNLGKIVLSVPDE
jgi:alcohol dehydrogenase